MSITLAYCIQTANEDTLKLSTRPDVIASSFKFLEALRCYPVPRETQSAGGVKYTGWENCDFRLKSPFFSRKRYEIGPWSPWNVNKRRIDLYRFR